MKVHIKICCISSIDEAWMAIKAGASALGLVSAMPSGPGVIPDERIVEIAAQLPPGVSSFLLTSRQKAVDIITQQHFCRTNTLQLVDEVEDAAYEELARALPGIGIVQVIHVTGPEAIEQARAVDGRVQGILLDSGNPKLARKELGGTGRTHNWEISREIVKAVKTPVFLAGGLCSENVAEAIRMVRPYGVDICSGVRTEGHLDADKLAAFVRAAWSVEV